MSFLKGGEFINIVHEQFLSMCPVQATSSCSLPLSCLEEQTSHRVPLGNLGSSARDSMSGFPSLNHNAPKSTRRSNKGGRTKIVTLLYILIPANLPKLQA